MNKWLVWWLTSAVVFFGAAGIYIYSQYTVIKADIINQHKEITTVYVQGVAQRELAPEDFSAGANHEAIFREFWKLIQLPEFVRIKVWDEDFRILFSDQPGLAGRQERANGSVAAALRGETLVLLGADREAVHQESTEREFIELIEVYVPVVLDGRVVGAVEFYQPATVFRRSVKEATVNTAKIPAGIAGAAWLLAGATGWLWFRRRPLPPTKGGMR